MHAFTTLCIVRVTTDPESTYAILDELPLPLSVSEVRELEILP